MSEEVQKAFAAALEAKKKADDGKADFLSEYCSVLAKLIKPTLEDYAANLTVRLSFPLISASGNVSSYALTIDLGRKGKHSLEFYPDFANECVAVRTATPYGYEPLPAIDLKKTTEKHIAELVASFLAPYAD